MPSPEWIAASNARKDENETAMRERARRESVRAAGPTLLAALEKLTGEYRTLLSMQPHYPSANQEDALNAAERAICSARGDT